MRCLVCTGSNSQLLGLMTSPIEDEAPAVRHLTLWSNGFSIEDGPLMHYDNPEHAELLDQLRSGYVSFFCHGQPYNTCSGKLHPTSSTSAWDSLWIFAFHREHTRPTSRLRDLEPSLVLVTALVHQYPRFRLQGRLMIQLQCQDNSRLLLNGPRPPSGSDRVLLRDLKSTNHCLPPVCRFAWRMGQGTLFS